MDECLAYFTELVSSPKNADSWSGWWERNALLVRSVFSREEYLRLKYRKLDAVRHILAERGLLASSEGEGTAPEFGETHCRRCGRELFWAIPGETTPDQIVEYATLIGNQDIERDRWIHPGVYCPTGCVFVMHNYGRLVDWKKEAK